MARNSECVLASALAHSPTLSARARILIPVVSVVPPSSSFLFSLCSRTNDREGYTITNSSNLSEYTARRAYVWIHSYAYSPTSAKYFRSIKDYSLYVYVSVDISPDIMKSATDEVILLLKYIKNPNNRESEWIVITCSKVGIANTFYVFAFPFGTESSTIMIRSLKNKIIF